MTEADWDVLVTTALIGTQRRTSDGGPGELLDRAAVATVARRAGRLPITAQPPPAAEPDTREPVSTSAAARLAAMLGIPAPGAPAAKAPRAGPEFVPQWLAAARERGKRPPDHLLPALLARAATIRELRPLLDTPRARWLARLNPDAWGFPELTVTATDDTPWRLGTRDERRAYLAALRVTDPARARELIESAWQEATAPERAAFLTALEENLGTDDEPLLERALDDRVPEVRSAAALALARVPESRLAGRMAERALATVTANDGRIAVSPARTADPAAARDGIAPGPPDERVLTIVSRTRLAAWARAWDEPPERIVAARMGGWSQVLITGWARAAIAQRDARWINALLTRLLASTDPAAARLAEQLARHADVPERAIPGDDDFPPMIANVLATLRFRHDMLRELDD